MHLQELKLHKVGQRYHDFELTKAIEIPELQCTLREFIHLPSGAEVMHISNDDPENVFSLSFRTLPDTSNGVAHILEHTVLCGSEKYPIKDPFFSMTRRSLNTFMNALTGSDFTCYPAASQVPKDFYNILEVYLDAVFHPKLDYLSFLQEGHRLEFSIPNDPQTPLEHKGIVYNEMLGALATGRARLHESLMEALFPNVSYGINSGGDPKEITTLTYEQLLDFHKKYYHPSRCLFYFYGNIPVEDHLDFLTQHAFNGVEKVTPLAPIPSQPRYACAKKIEKSYPIGHEEDPKNKTLIGFGWLTAHILEQEKLLALAILEIVLLDTDASTLKKALLQSGHCKQVSTYLDSDIQEAPLLVTLSGCEGDHADELEEIIFTTLRAVAKEGIPLDKIENAIHQLEFHYSEITGEHEPFGLALFMRAGLLKHHGAEPENGLSLHYLFNKIRQKNLQDPHYFPQLIETYLLDNPHFVRIVMTPDIEMAGAEVMAEKISLKKIRDELSPEQEKQLLKQAADLSEAQITQQDADINVLPKFDLSDVPKDVRVFDMQKEKVGILEVYSHKTFTNDIIYMNLIYDLPQISEEELPYVRLMTILATQVGSGGRNYVETLDYIQANTGGIQLTLNFNIHADDCGEFSPTLTIRGKALHRKVEQLCQLMHDLATSLDFDNIPRLKELIHKHYNSLQEGLTSNAIRYAINLSASGLDPSSKIANSWHGLDYYLAIRNLAMNFDAEIEGLISKLNDLKERLLGLQNPHLVITCDAESYEDLRSKQFYQLNHLPLKPFTPFHASIPLTPVTSQARLISSPVAFTGKVLKTVPYIHPDSPALSIASYVCDNVVLHQKVREQGGAYGGGATSNTLTGNFYFYSYRDPNIVSTLEAFHEAIEVLAKGDFDDDDLEEAKLEMVQKSDAPVPPGARGIEAYALMREKKTTAIRQKQRDTMLKVTRQEVIDAVKRHLVPMMRHAATVVFASKHLVDKENSLMMQKGLSPLPSLKI